MLSLSFIYRNALTLKCWNVVSEWTTSSHAPSVLGVLTGVHYDTSLLSSQQQWTERIPPICPPATPTGCSSIALALSVQKAFCQNTGGVVVPFSGGSSQHRDWIQVSLIAGGFFTSWDTREAQEYWSGWLFPSPGDLLTQELNQGLLHCRQILH